jgi:hypothetical protein
MITKRRTPLFPPRVPPVEDSRSPNPTPNNTPSLMPNWRVLRRSSVFPSLVVVEAILAFAAKVDAQNSRNSNEDADPFQRDPGYVADRERCTSDRSQMCRRKRRGERGGMKWVEGVRGLVLLIVPVWLLHVVELVELGCACGCVSDVMCNVKHRAYSCSRSSQSCPWGCSGTCGRGGTARQWGSG